MRFDAMEKGCLVFLTLVGAAAGGWWWLYGPANFAAVTMAHHFDGQSGGEDA